MSRPLVCVWRRRNPFAFDSYLDSLCIAGAEHGDYPLWTPGLGFVKDRVVHFCLELARMLVNEIFRHWMTKIGF